MRVLIYSDDPGYVDAASINTRLAFLLSQAGHEVDYAAPSTDAGMGETCRTAGITYHLIDYDPVRFPAKAVGSRLEPWTIFADAKPDAILFIDTNPASSLAAKQLAYALGIPYSVVIQDFPTDASVSLATQGPGIRLTLQRSMAVACVQTADAGRISSAYGIARRRIVEGVSNNLPDTTLMEAVGSLLTIPEGSVREPTVIKDLSAPPYRLGTVLDFTSEFAILPYLKDGWTKMERGCGISGGSARLSLPLNNPSAHYIVLTLNAFTTGGQAGGDLDIEVLVNGTIVGTLLVKTHIPTDYSLLVRLPQPPSDTLSIELKLPVHQASTRTVATSNEAVSGLVVRLLCLSDLAATGRNTFLSLRNLDIPPGFHTDAYIIYLCRPDLWGGETEDNGAAQGNMLVWWLLNGQREYPAAAPLPQTAIQVLMAPVADGPSGQRLTLTRLIYGIWLFRSDLRITYPLDTPEDVDRLIAWFWTHGIFEHRLDKQLSAAGAFPRLRPVGDGHHQETALTAAHYICWLMHEELHDRFDINTTAGLTGLLSWMRDNAPTFLPFQRLSALKMQGRPLPGALGEDSEEQFPALDTLVRPTRAAQDEKSLRVCIVTPDLAGFVKNGGIGTASRALGETLAAGQFDVTLLYVHTVRGIAPESDPLILAEYKRAGITVAGITSEDSGDGVLPPAPAHPTHIDTVMAFQVYQWLKARTFDIVLLPEWRGLGYYALSAKRGGIAFVETTFIVQTHSPTLWHAMGNGDAALHDPRQMLTIIQERKSVELADVVISPSHYMLRWMREAGYRLPARCFVHANPLPAHLARRKAQGSTAPRQVTEIVFFGRLEYRKGLVEFCQAVTKLIESGVKPEKITLLGKFGTIGSTHSAMVIASHGRNWGVPVSILDNLDHQQAIDYLAGPRRIAVICSTLENAPYTVLECLAAGVPFLARRTGGIPELVAMADYDICLFSGGPANLASRLAIALSEGGTVPRPAADPQKVMETWRQSLPDLHANMLSTPPKPLRELPLVSVCLTHYRRPHLLRQAIASLYAQDYPNLEVVLVDDGSGTPDTNDLLLELAPEFERRGWIVHRRENGYLGAARNTAVQLARGEYFLFMDDDNVARPNEVSVLVRAALNSDADVTVCVFDVFQGQQPPDETRPPIERFLPLGDALSFSLVDNVMGDANALIRRSAFEDIGGFSEDYGVGHEDIELLASARLKGKSVIVVPEPLFWYRRSSDSMLTSTLPSANRMRPLRPFLRSLSPELGEMAYLVQGLWGARLAERGLVSGATYGLPDGMLLPKDMQPSTGDPNGAGAIDSAVRILALAGMPATAMDLVDRHKPVGAEAAFVALAMQGEEQKALTVLKDLLSGSGAQSERDTLKTMASIALRLATEDRPQPQLEAAVDQLLAKHPSEILGWLVVAHSGARLGDANRTAISLGNAVAFAQQEYLSRRPDVARTADPGVANPALAHFERHGHVEGMSWPQQEHFTALMTRLTPTVLENWPADKVELFSTLSRLFGNTEMFVEGLSATCAATNGAVLIERPRGLLLGLLPWLEGDAAAITAAGLLVMAQHAAITADKERALTALHSLQSGFKNELTRQQMAQLYTRIAFANDPKVYTLLQRLAQAAADIPQALLPIMLAWTIASHKNGDAATAELFAKALSLAEQDYNKRYPDIAAAVGRNALPSGWWHYRHYGHSEGRQWPFGAQFLALAGEGATG